MHLPNYPLLLLSLKEQQLLTAKQTYWSRVTKQGKISISIWAKLIFLAMSVCLWEEEKASTLLGVMGVTGLRACGVSEPNISLTKAPLCFSDLARLQLLNTRMQGL